MSVRNSIMNLVLYFFEELNRNFCLGVVVDAGGVDFQNLTVKHLFGSADVADTLQPVSYTHLTLPTTERG